MTHSSNRFQSHPALLLLLLHTSLLWHKGYKLSGGVLELEPHMLALDRVTQEGRLLMQLVRHEQSML